MYDFQSNDHKIEGSLVGGFVSALYRVVTSGKKLNSTLSLSIQVYKWVLVNC